eukprot:1390059-Pleurochrysis_carterae.AAC.1
MPRSPPCPLVRSRAHMIATVKSVSGVESGVMSPKPTVTSVTIAQYAARAYCSEAESGSERRTSSFRAQPECTSPSQPARRRGDKAVKRGVRQRQRPRLTFVSARAEAPPNAGGHVVDEQQHEAHHVEHPCDA